jgi:hypothetical protein
VAPKLDLVIVVLSDRTDQLDFALVDELTDLFAAGRER